MKIQAYIIELFGIIQGVGFRPFVYHLAHSLNLKGYVQNRYSMLFIYLESQNRATFECFIDTLLNNHPPHARISHYQIREVSSLEALNDFKILPSKAESTDFIPCSLPLDTRICEDCLIDMRKNGRFFQYAFSTCAYCGPRYSILNALPYDRNHTSMREFVMCKNCEAEYKDPFNRRFHAQPISCSDCAIRLSLVDEQGKLHAFEDAKDDIYLIKEVASAIKAGKIVAIKGIGGFNLVVDSNNKEAISLLRKRKERPFKPFALMFKNIEDIQSLALLSSVEKQALLSPQAPIVLLLRHYQKGGILDESSLQLIAPKVETLGAILPYNGIMHLLFDMLEKPIVFTSANISSEPIITDVDELREKLYTNKRVIDIILDYNRDISHGVDDSIMRLMAGSMRPLRLARGYAPLKVTLPFINAKNNLIMGVGAQQKSTISLIDTSKQALISPYIGDLQSVDSIKRYEEASSFFCSIYKKDVDLLVYDLHSQYVSSQKAMMCEIEKYALAHHKAHFYAILGEAQALTQEGLGIIWDGTGLGEDGHIWGGECFLYHPMPGESGDMQRVFHFEEFMLLGGESAIRDIGKLALSLMWHCELEGVEEVVHFDSKDINLLKTAYQKRAYPLTSSVGRIVDGVAYILGLLEYQSYEGQSGALLESYALKDSLQDVKPYEFRLYQGKVEYTKTIKALIQGRGNPTRAAHRFLETLAHIALALAKSQSLSQRVYFSGGVFQNKFLCDRIQHLFTSNNIPFYMHQELPCNDSNISFGQAVFGAMQSPKKG